MTDKQLLEKIVKGQEELKQEVSKIKKTVREEIEAEAKKIRGDALLAQMHSDGVIEEIKDSVKDLTISNTRLEKGLDVVKTEQKAQGKTLSEHSKLLNAQGKVLETHGKALKKLTALAQKNYKSIEIMSGNFDEDIINNGRRIDRIEDHLDLPPYKAKQ